MRKKLCVLILLPLMMNVLAANNSNVNEATVAKTVKSVRSLTTLPAALVERGVAQAAALWTAQDGSSKDFEQFCQDFYCKNLDEKTALFYRLCANFEAIYGHNNRISIELQRPEQLVGYTSTSVDPIFSAYDGTAHLQEDMFANKLAFVVILNFPHFSLSEKQKNGANWSELEWGFVRLGDVFTTRIPSDVMRNLNNVTAAANSYIDNYNIDMQQVGSQKNEFFWKSSLPLITHWGLRDELKAAYADNANGLAKQTVIYDVMKRIIQDEVPADVVKQDLSYKWYPVNNMISMNGIEILTEEKAPKSRYQYLLDFFKAEKAADPYCSSNFIQRKFEDEYEISVDQTLALFDQLLSAPCLQQVADVISKRLGRKLKPYDIWYDGFKSRSDVNQSELDRMVKAKYPTKEAFEQGLPDILAQLGFTPEKARFICDHVAVDASLGAGHAWGTKMKDDKSVLRTRVGADGMDYKGYNIGVHEFGHNVEQTISMHDVSCYFMNGVPNTGFTEALAFTFQSQDLELLGIHNQDEMTEDLNALDLFWECYEIMGVSMVDIKVWQWMYAHPNANADQLKTAVVSIAKEVWNQYYAPVFKVKDEPILAVYSHMIIDPLYLSAYPIGHIIEFQLESYLKGKVVGDEVCRIYKQGRLTPDLWMQRAVGEKLSAKPLVERTSIAVEHLQKAQKKSKKK